MRTDHERARERDKALRAPLIIVVATRCDRSTRVPLIEQMLSAGAAAHSIMLAAFAQGLVMWRTGEAAYDDTVKAALGLEADDGVVGFIYIGTEIVAPHPTSPRSPGVRRVPGRREWLLLTLGRAGARTPGSGARGAACSGTCGAPAG